MKDKIIKRLKILKETHIEGIENGLLDHKEPCICKTCVGARNDVIDSAIAVVEKEV